jgi:GNAT superfamily N-acetyltransferase
MQDLTIRPATLADVTSITAVHCSTVDEWRDPKTRQPASYAALDLFGRWYNGGPWMSPEMCAVHLNHLLLEGHFPLVAEVEGALVGEAEYYLNREPAPFGPGLHLSILYIHAAWQKHGVGRALIDAGVELARCLGLAALTTQPEPEASGFYTRAGFLPWLHAREMQLDTGGPLPVGLAPMQRDTGLPEHLALRIGRYQCGVQGWDGLWPYLALPGFQNLNRWVWSGEVERIPVILGLREQLGEPTQVDGYAWLPPDAPLASAVSALRALAAQERFTAVDLLLPETSLPELRAIFQLDYQTALDLWARYV